MPADRAARLIEETKRKYGISPKDSREARIKEILDRPQIVMTPELVQRERDLGPERKKAIELALPPRGMSDNG